MPARRRTLDLANPFGEPERERAPVDGASGPAEDAPTPPPVAEPAQVAPRAASAAGDAGGLGLLVVGALDPAAIGRFAPVAGDGIVVGRSGAAGLRVDDPGVSRRHLRVSLRDGGRCVADDLGSTNGTYLNGTAIRSATLVEGDRLRIGTGTELVFGRRPSGLDEALLRQVLGAAGAGAWDWSAASGQLVLCGGLVRSLRGGGDAGPPEEDGWARVLPEERDGLRARLRRALERVEPVELECRLRTADGGIVWVAMSGEPFRDRAGVPVRVAGTAMDVTARRRADDERRRLEAQVQVSERLASVGTLAAGVAHEINNPLCFVLANLQYVAEHVAGAAGARLPPEVEAALSDSLAGAARIRAVVNDLRQHAEARAAGPGAVDVAEVIDFCLRIAFAKVRDRARLRREVAPLPRVRGDRTRLGQAILNLLVNAADAIPPGRPDENEVAVRARRDAAARRVVVEVSDTGAGFSPDEAARAFDPFCTARRPGLGTGLGLFVCHGLVSGMGGEISLAPGPGGRGTTFRLSLPLHEGAAADPGPAPGPGGVAAAG